VDLGEPISRACPHVIPLSHLVLRRLARGKLAVTPESNRSTSVSTLLAACTPAHGTVRIPSARQTLRVDPDIIFFRTHMTPMSMHVTELTTFLIPMTTLVIALFCHMTFVM
jgi:hypothetical protein